MIRKNRRINNRGQVTLFIVLAIVIVLAIILFFSLSPSVGRNVPENMRPIYDYYVSCLENEADMGISILGAQGGYIELPEFEAGSPYVPFSSQLSFFGQAVPYWMYVSGNNFLKEQIPTKSKMESQLSKYVGDRLVSCDFSEFEVAGYEVYIEENGSVSSKINDNVVDLNINNKVTIFKDGSSIVIDNHKFSVKSKLGRFYEMALKIYEKQKTTMFLENYAIDVMRLYAPVDGVELGCAPKIFVDEQIQNDLYDGLAANMNSIKFDGSYYRLSSDERKYFVVDVGFDIDEQVNIMYNKDWPSRIQIYGDRIVKPVGTQAGLSALGFCYTPYHLVYDISFPVMIQFYDTENLFQFPVSVIIDNSEPRKAIPSSSNRVNLASEVCKYENSQIEVYTYDNELNPIEAALSFTCLDSSCNIGETKINGYDAVYKGGISQCVNGFITATASGYAEGKVQISTNSESTANILLRKEYELDLELDVDIESAVITFFGEDYSATVVYPEMKTVKLIEGEYNITAYVYENSALTLPGTTNKMCVDVPVTGPFGLLGLEEEKCYNIDVPSMDVEMAVVGGGMGIEYIAESMLRSYNILNINIPLFGKPASIDELQYNYDKVESSMVFVEFKE